MSVESDMERVDCTSPELNLDERSFIPDYFGVSTYFHTLGTGFTDLDEVELDEAVDWAVLEVRVINDALEEAHDVRWSWTNV